MRAYSIKIFTLLIALLFSLAYAEIPLFDNSSIESEEVEKEAFFEVDGFIDERFGYRLSEVGNNKSFTLGEFRSQLGMQKSLKQYHFELVSDFKYDASSNNTKINLRTGEGLIDLRKLSLSFSPFNSLDIKIGRQVLTWGTGDLLFINDLFSKDWNSFFIGRDIAYLKAPSDALKVSFFGSSINYDFVWVPTFSSDRFITGERLGYYSPATKKITGKEAIIRPVKKAHSLSSGEYSMRLSSLVDSTEFAFYGYHGYWKTPEGVLATGEYFFPRLQVYGFSLVRPAFGGIFNIEAGYYNSLDDKKNNNPLIKNSQVKLLTGFEREIAKNFTGGGQYYVEKTIKKIKDQYRHMVTLRLTKLLLNQNLITSFFIFYSPSDQDGHLRPKVEYKVSDAWKVEAGANIFFGKEQSTFWGQFEKNNNIFSGVRFSF